LFVFELKSLIYFFILDVIKAHKKTQSAAQICAGPLKTIANSTIICELR